jgi:hypothetical protein
MVKRETTSFNPLEIVALVHPPWTITRSQDKAVVGSEVGRLSIGRGLLQKVKMWALGKSQKYMSLVVTCTPISTKRYRQSLTPMFL